MRILSTAAIALAIGGLTSLTSAYAAPNYVPGGTLQQAGMCQVSTDGGEGFYGYMTQCPAPPKSVRARKPHAH